MTELQKISTSFTPEIFEVLQAYDKGGQKKVLFLVMEYMELDLKKFIKLGQSSGFTNAHIKKIVYNLLCCLRFLHKSNVIHRDIKPANILINKNCEVKITDFGISRSLPESRIGKGSGNSKRVRDSIQN